MRQYRQNSTPTSTVTLLPTSRLPLVPTFWNATSHSACGLSYRVASLSYTPHLTLAVGCMHTHLSYYAGLELSKWRMVRSDSPTTSVAWYWDRIQCIQGKYSAQYTSSSAPSYPAPAVHDLTFELTALNGVLLEKNKSLHTAPYFNA